MRAMILACMERTVECDWRKWGWGLGEPTHIRSRRWNGDSTLFAAVRYYRCIPQRTTRGSNGLRAVIRRPPVCQSNADDCPANLKRLADRVAKRKPRRPICTPPASACVRARHPTRARICVRVVDSDHALAWRARRCPMDAPRRLASRPRHVRDGPARRMRARHPTRNRVYTLASTRGIVDRNRNKHKQTSLPRGPGAPGRKFRMREVDFLGLKNGRLPAGGPSPALRLEARGVA
jgi:hypothetical protein